MMGKNMRHALEFISKCAGWHTYDRRCQATVSAIKRLEYRGLVEMGPFFMFRLVRNTL